jgi:hypothetical protein
MVKKPIDFSESLITVQENSSEGDVSVCSGTDESQYLDDSSEESKQIKLFDIESTFLSFTNCS